MILDRLGIDMEIELVEFPDVKDPFSRDEYLKAPFIPFHDNEPVIQKVLEDLVGHGVVRPDLMHNVSLGDLVVCMGKDGIYLLLEPLLVDVDPKGGYQLIQDEAGIVLVSSGSDHDQATGTVHKKLSQFIEGPGMKTRDSGCTMEYDPFHGNPTQILLGTTPSICPCTHDRTD